MNTYFTYLEPPWKNLRCTFTNLTNSLLPGSTFIDEFLLSNWSKEVVSKKAISSIQASIYGYDYSISKGFRGILYFWFVKRQNAAYDYMNADFHLMTDIVYQSVFYILTIHRDWTLARLLGRSRRWWWTTRTQLKFEQPLTWHWHSRWLGQRLRRVKQ